MVTERNTIHKHHIGVTGASPKMLTQFLFALYIFGSFSSIANAQTSSEQVKLPSSEDTNNKGYKLLLGTDKDSLSKVPNFFKSYGKLGFNYDIDRGQPYIWCEKTNSTCVGAREECVRSVKCFPERRSHLLGCMAVIVYNISENSISNNHSDLPVNSSMIKGCWSHYDSELRECLHESECISHTRNTGSAGRAAKFCCCRTHHCNQNITLEIKTNETRNDPVDKTPSYLNINDMHLMPRFLLGSTIFLFFTVIFIILCVGATSAFSFWLVRRKRRHTENCHLRELDNLNRSNGAFMEITSECEALLGAKIINLRNPSLCELLSTGQFSEIYRAEVDHVSVAIRIYNISDTNGWINEQDIFAIKNLRANDNIIDFLAALRHERQYWFIYKYYYNGSVFDYLDNHNPTIHETCKILSTMLNGLAFLHEEFFLQGELKPSIVHRDFKSKNVLLKSDLTACIGDFAFAVKCENGRMTNEENQSQVGTRRYMSPEVLEGATEFSAFAFQQIDVYAASLIIWEILSKTRVPEHPEEHIAEYMLPYEREIGKNPTLGRLRELVVIRKFRPMYRLTLLDNPILEKVVKTMEDMWEAEADGRITSSCARDRMTYYFNACLGGCQLNESAIIHFSPDEASLSSSNCSIKSTSSSSDSFDCPSATGTTIPIAQANGSSSQDRLTSSDSSFSD